MDWGTFNYALSSKFKLTHEQLREQPYKWLCMMYMEMEYEKEVETYHKILLSGFAK